MNIGKSLLAYPELEITEESKEADGPFHPMSFDRESPPILVSKRAIAFLESLHISEMEENMLVMCVHTWNPKTPGMTEKEFFPRREEFMKGLMAKKVPVKSVHSVMNFKEGKAWCVWETDTLKRLQGIMAEHPMHTEFFPVKLAPQIM